MKANLNLRPQLGVMLHITPELNQTPQATYSAFTDLVRKLDGIGFDNAWVTEHHFNDMSLTPAPLNLINHFLGKTENIKIGCAALLLGFHNPIEVAEQLAVLQSLYPHRILCGFAKGGPFESQNAAFKADKEISRERMNEALPAIMQLWNSGTPQSHQGRHYQWENITLQPRCDLHSEQLFVATGDEQTVQMAAQNGLGLMSAQFWDSDKIDQQIKLYTRFAQHAPNMMVARGLFIDDNPSVARQMALEHIELFREEKAKHWGKHPGPMAKLDPEALLSRMLCGSPEQVRQQLQRLLRMGVKHLALNPLTHSHQVRFQQLHWFKDEIWQPLMAQSDAA